jgi:hypothetical protein
VLAVEGAATIARPADDIIDFVLEADGAATRVTHREEFGFPVPLRWALEPLLRSWLESSMVEEMARLKDLLEVDELEVDAGA